MKRHKLLNTSFKGNHNFLDKGLINKALDLDNFLNFISFDIMALLHNDFLFYLFNDLFFHLDGNWLRLSTITMFLNDDSFIPEFLNNFGDLYFFKNHFFLVNVYHIRFIEDIRNFFLHNFIKWFLLNDWNILWNCHDFADILIKIFRNLFFTVYFLYLSFDDLIWYLLLLLNLPINQRVISDSNFNLLSLMNSNLPVATNFLRYCLAENS